MERTDEIDVRQLLPQVKTPTLMHCDRKRAVLPEWGRLLAAGLPGARYVSLALSIAEVAEIAEISRRDRRGAEKHFDLMISAPRRISA